MRNGQVAFLFAIVATACAGKVSPIAEPRLAVPTTTAPAPRAPFALRNSEPLTMTEPYLDVSRAVDEPQAELPPPPVVPKPVPKPDKLRIGKLVLHRIADVPLIPFGPSDSLDGPWPSYAGVTIFLSRGTGLAKLSPNGTIEMIDEAWLRGLLDFRSQWLTRVDNVNAKVTQFRASFYTSAFLEDSNYAVKRVGTKLVWSALNRSSARRTRPEKACNPSKDRRTFDGTQIDFCGEYGKAHVAFDGQPRTPLADWVKACALEHESVDSLRPASAMIDQRGTLWVWSATALWSTREVKQPVSFPDQESEHQRTVDSREPLSLSDSQLKRKLCGGPFISVKEHQDESEIHEVVWRGQTLRGFYVTVEPQDTEGANFESLVRAIKVAIAKHPGARIFCLE